MSPRGPVIRAEACAADFYSALDAAIAKLDSRLSRAADRRRVHRGRHAPVSVAAATASLAFTQPAAAGVATLHAAAAARPSADGSTCSTSRTTSRGTSCGRRNTRASR